MPAIPRDTKFDSTLALLSEGYAFISNQCRRYQSDIVETRLMLRKAFCMQGEEAARIFYEDERFTRRGAMPIMGLILLQDKGSANLLDGGAHRWRKKMFMSLMTRESIKQLVDVMDEQWHAYIRKWETMSEVILHNAVQEVLCRAVCRWASVPLKEHEVKQRTHEFGAMIDGAGAVGPRNWRGILLRMRTERWIRSIIEQVRTDKLDVKEGSAAHVIAWHRGLNGELLDTKIAAVELINILRPTIANAWFITFAALALHQYPEYRQKLGAGGEEALELFVQEVRRFYPLFPLVGGRAQKEFDWRGHHFSKGTWMLLDLYGTNHDARIWRDPDEFQPERFRQWNKSAFNFIPQGGGDHYSSHRCAGEWITMELMKRAVHLLTTAMHYDVPKQDLRIKLSRMPARPKSSFVISRVRAVR